MEDGRGKLSNVGRFLKNIHLSCLPSVRAGHLLLALFYVLTVTAHCKDFACSVMAVYSLVEVSEIGCSGHTHLTHFLLCFEISILNILFLGKWGCVCVFDILSEVEVNHPS